MNYYDLIRSRSSVRNYNSLKDLEKDVILRILDAGRLAPSAANLQPWSFIVVSKRDMLQKISACYQRDWIKRAPHILIVKGNREQAWTRADGYNSLETDLAIAMTHIVLAAANEGVGTCWIAAFDKEKLYDLLNLSEQEEVFAITPLGYPASTDTAIEKKRKDLGDIVSFI